MHGDANVLMTLVVFLAAMVIAVPIATRLGMGAVLGYLLAGVAIGPHAFGLAQIDGTVHHLAELGVVLMLFLIGLELDLAKLWAMRRSVFGVGTFQLVACGILFAVAFRLFGFSWPASAILGLTLGLSSTAVAVSLMTDRGLMGTSTGSTVFGVLLFQDIAAIPILIGVGVAFPSEGAVPFLPLPALGAVIVLVMSQRYVLPHVLRFVAKYGSRELFVAIALLLVVGIMLGLARVGVSAGLGAFLAGVLLASSEFRHELEADLAPFKGLFLGLFFLTIGAAIDLSLLRQEWLAIVALLLAFMVTKCAVQWLVAKAIGMVPRERLAFAALLGQGGEFGFVVITMTVSGKMLPPSQAAWLNLLIALSIGLSPLLMRGVDYAMATWFRGEAPKEADVDLHHSPVIIAGFGRYGQIAGRLLLSNGIRPTVLDHDSETIDNMRRFGFKVYYGDACRLDLLETAGAAHAKAIIIAVDDEAKIERIAQTVKSHFPHLTIIARARDVRHYYALRTLGVHYIQRELFESSLVSGRIALERLGVGRYEAREMADRFRATNIEFLERMAKRRDEVDAATFASEVRRDREELERQLTAQAEAPKQHSAWQDGKEKAEQERELPAS